MATELQDFRKQTVFSVDSVVLRIYSTKKDNHLLCMKNSYFLGNIFYSVGKVIQFWNHIRVTK